MITKTKGKQVHEMMMEQFKTIKDCLYSFEDFLNAACTEDSDPKTLKNLCDKVLKCESDADISLRNMIDSLAGTAFLPATREDFISIGTNCDKIANTCEGISFKMVLQDFRFPKDFHEDLKEIITITHKQFKALEHNISLLFSKFNELLKDHSSLDEIRALESEIDVIERRLLEKVYSKDMYLGLAERMLLEKSVQSVCDISDIIENIADKIQIMLVTRKA